MSYSYNGFDISSILVPNLSYLSSTNTGYKYNNTDLGSIYLTNNNPLINNYLVNNGNGTYTLPKEVWSAMGTGFSLDSGTTGVQAIAYDSINRVLYAGVGKKYDL